MPTQRRSDFLRQRAAEVRAKAQGMRDRDVRRTMLSAAAEYEALAQFSEGIEAASGLPPRGSDTPPDRDGS
jgi:hypothetical protein